MGHDERRKGATLAELQADAKRLLGDELKHPRVGSTLALVEEMGELVKEVMGYEIYGDAKAKEEMPDEVGDILFSLFEVCNAYDISLEEAYLRKVEKIESKREKWIGKYSEALAERRKKFD